MKLAITVAAVVLGLTACSEPIPQSQWKQYETKMTDVQGFEDCTMVTFKTATQGDPIRVVRCPLSITGSNYTVPRGKSRATLNTAVVEADADEARAKKIAELEASINQLAAKLKDLK